MTFKLIKTKLFKAIMATLCALAVAFAVVLLLPRGGASADEINPEVADGVTWWYKTETEDGDVWTQFNNGTTLFTYTEGVDYSDSVRAEVTTDGTTTIVDASGLSFSGTFAGESVTTLENATKYTAIVNGYADIADADKTIGFTIEPRVIELSVADLEDYYGVGEENRLWLLGDNDELGDTLTYYDPDAEFNNDYGAKVKTGVLYNSYARYTGTAQNVTLNADYRVNGGTLADYASAIDDVTYTNNSGDNEVYDAQPVIGKANVVNKITTRAVITFTDNWKLDNGDKSVTLTKEWYIVTIVNALRLLDGETAADGWAYDGEEVVKGWAYGGEVPALYVRPEHGDSAVFTLKKGSAAIARFAVKYSGKGNGTVLEYYDVKTENGKYVIDTTKPLDADYYTQLLSPLTVDAYTLEVSVPAYTATANHEHWWDNAEPETINVVYSPIAREYRLDVSCYELTEENVSMDASSDKDVIVKLLTDHVAYNAMENNLPEIEITFRGEKLVLGVDYDLISHNVGVGKASFTFVGKGSFSGLVQFDDTYDIDPAVNTWKDVPSVMYWTYGNYDKQMNLINATPTYLDNINDVSFKITTDMFGETPAAQALAYFLLTDGLVSDDVAEALNALPVGTYYLFASVKESTNYKALVQRGVAFKVFPAANSWKDTPDIVDWTEGQFKSINMPIATPMYGRVSIVIKDSNGKDVYSNITGVNKLAAAKAGMYTLTAIVMESNDYTGLEYSTVFTVHEKPGIPVWATVLIVLGALLLVAIIVFVLIKTKVLRILTDKLMVNIRTQAAVDATVAAVRANKKNEEAKQLVAEFKQQEEAEAKKEEQKKARKARAEQAKTVPLEQKIAALEEKARKANARAEKMRERAEAIQLRADRMREASTEQQKPAIEPTAEAAATETETPTEG